MSFWGSERLKQEAGKIVEGFDPEMVKHGAYELSLGGQVFVTSEKAKTRKLLKDGEQLCIPPGQFGLLLTKEKVKIPHKAIGFISIKARVKFRGLVNVSGFHVDPGFEGKLKFSVYNAGSQDLILQQGKPLFLLWLSDLSDSSDPYKKSGHVEITSEDVMDMQGEVASPNVLKEEIRALKNSVSTLRALFIGLILAIVPLALDVSVKMFNEYMRASGKGVSSAEAPGKESPTNNAPQGQVSDKRADKKEKKGE